MRERIFIASLTLLTVAILFVPSIWHAAAVLYIYMLGLLGWAYYLERTRRKDTDNE